ncbi:MAG: hypothetical protein NT038_09820 [Euryarchaeota archaeon]|nr:hypothetical protein [Euryarchaeota archaeon]
MKKNQRSFITNNQAIAGIVVAVMILGLVVSVIAIIQTVYLPKWMEEREAEHMGVVADQFSQLKHSIDTLDASNSTTPITASITLGSKELGFLPSSRAFGHLQLAENAFKITSGDVYMFNTFTYSSQNGYFLDQTYTYEAGALILSQTDGNVMLYTPPFTVNLVGTNVYLVWNCINLRSQGGTTSVGGYGNYPLRVSYADRVSEPPILPVSSIDITTSYPVLWKNYLNESFQKADLTYGSGASFYTIVESPPDKITIYFSGYSVTLNIKKTVINLQIGPGWI